MVNTNVPLFHSFRCIKTNPLCWWIIYSIWADNLQCIHSVMFHFLSIVPTLVNVRCSVIVHITHDIIRNEGYLPQTEGVTLILVEVIGRTMKSKSLDEPCTVCSTTRIYLGRSHLYLWPRLHASGEGGRADLVAEIFSADSSACITQAPKGRHSTAWMGQLTCA